MTRKMRLMRRLVGEDACPAVESAMSRPVRRIKSARGAMIVRVIVILIWEGVCDRGLEKDEKDEDNKDTDARVAW